MMSMASKKRVRAVVPAARPSVHGHRTHRERPTKVRRVRSKRVARQRVNRCRLQNRLNTTDGTGHGRVVKIVNVAKSMMLDVGSAPLLYLMIALSVVSMAIVLERAWLFGTMREDLDALLRDLAAYLSVHD